MQSRKSRPYSRSFDCIYIFTAGKVLKLALMHGLMFAHAPMYCIIRKKLLIELSHVWNDYVSTLKVRNLLNYFWSFLPKHKKSSKTNLRNRYYLSLVQAKISHPDHIKAVIHEAARTQENNMSEIVASIFIVLDRDDSKLKLTVFGAVAEVGVVCSQD